MKTVQLEGNRIRFVLQPAAPGDAQREFHGVVDGDHMRGEATMASGAIQWTARSTSTPGRMCADIVELPSTLRAST